MIVYIDTSVIVRKILNAPASIDSWGSWNKAYSSRIWIIESLRVLHRLRMNELVSDEDVARLRAQVDLIDQTLDIIPVSEEILLRSSESFPTIVGTLDAIHLSSALAVHSIARIDCFLTHDKQLATAARSVGFKVAGDR